MTTVELDAPELPAACAECGQPIGVIRWVCPMPGSDPTGMCTARFCSLDHQRAHERRHATGEFRAPRRRTPVDATAKEQGRPAVQCSEEAHAIMRVNRTVWLQWTFNRRAYPEDGFSVGQCISCGSDVAYPDPEAAS